MKVIGLIVATTTAWLLLHAAAQNVEDYDWVEQLEERHDNDLG